MRHWSWTVAAVLLLAWSGSVVDAACAPVNFVSGGTAESRLQTALNSGTRAFCLDSVTEYTAWTEGVSLNSGATVTITGQGPTTVINLGSAGRFIGQASFAVNWIIEDLTVTNGNALSLSSTTGGAFRMSSLSSLTLTRVVVSMCSATSGGAVHLDSAVALTMTDTTIQTSVGDSTGNGGAVNMASGASLSATGSTFSNNAANLGGAIYGTGVTITLTNSACTDNDATGSSTPSGGCLNVVGTSSVTLSTVTLSGNSATSNGGGLAVAGTLTLVWSGGSATSNGASAQGGALYASAIVAGSSFDLDGVSLSSNVAGTNGGAIALNGGSPAATLSGCSFTSNSATLGSGGALSLASILTDTLIDGTTFFTTNYASGSAAAAGGGAIAASSSSTLTVSGTASFTGNTAASSGGALSFSSTSLTLGSASVVTLESNRAVTSGGAVRMTGAGATFTLGGASASLSSNAVSGVGLGVGGAVVLQVSSSLSCTVGGLTLNDNSARTQGGAIHSSGASSVLLTGPASSSFMSDNVCEEAAGLGGALYVTTGTATLEGVVFDNNVAPTAGGAIYATAASTTLSLTSLTFTDNTATTDRGGGLFVTSSVSFSSLTDIYAARNVAGTFGGFSFMSATSGAVIMTNSVLTNNTGGSGAGAMIINTVTGSITNVEFTGNVASSGSGGAVVLLTSGTAVTFDSCTFTANTVFGNTTTSGGGAMRISNTATVTITGGSFTSNQVVATEAGAGGGALRVLVTGLVLTGGVVFDRNTAAAAGGAVYLHSSGSVTVTNAAFVNNVATTSGGALYSVSTAAGPTWNTATFTANTALTGLGGAVSLEATMSSPLTLAGLVTFTGNVAAANCGGALALRSGAAVTDNYGAVFTANRAEGSSSLGGGLYVSGTGSTTYSLGGSGSITLTFEDNVAGSHGGAVALTTSGATLSSTLSTSILSMSGNTAGGDGGGLACRSGATASLAGSLQGASNEAGGNGGALFVIADCAFTVSGSVSATLNTATGFGGALYYAYSGGALTLPLSASFTRNTAGAGGAVYLASGVPSSVWTAATGSSNVATGASGGGAVLLNGVALSLVSSGSWSANTASSGSGGAFELAGSAASLTMAAAPGTDLLMRDNVAGEHGGAIHGDSGTALVVSVSGGGKARFENNTAAQDGGALWLRSMGSIDLTSSAGDLVFTDNTARGLAGLTSGGGGALLVDYASTPSLDLSGAVFEGNWADGGSGGSLHLRNSVVSLTAASFVSNSATVSGGDVFLHDTDLVASTCSFTASWAGSSGSVLATAATGPASDLTLTTAVLNGVGPSALALVNVAATIEALTASGGSLPVLTTGSAATLSLTSFNVSGNTLAAVGRGATTFVVGGNSVVTLTNGTIDCNGATGAGLEEGLSATLVLSAVSVRDGYPDIVSHSGSGLAAACVSGAPSASDYDCPPLGSLAVTNYVCFGSPLTSSSSSASSSSSSSSSFSSSSSSSSFVTSATTVTVTDTVTSSSSSTLTCSDVCDATALCTVTNTSEGLSCSCPAGYTGLGTLGQPCTNVNECSSGLTHSCEPATQVCSDTVGSFTCNCLYGPLGGVSGSCRSSLCGDSIVSGLEECDDGNAVGGDGCTAACFEEESGCGAAVWDCAGTCQGLAFFDGCGECAGGESAVVPESARDLCGLCFGALEWMDACGMCNGTNADMDECGVCFGDGSSCWGCDRVPNSGKVVDLCGICGGDGTTCLGCNGLPMNAGGVLFDECGVCGGSGGPCLFDCTGVSQGPLVFDCSGTCGGNATVDLCGVCSGGQTTVPPNLHFHPTCGCFDDCNCALGNADLCGVCGGDSSTCLGCDGVFNPSNLAVVDVCGVCGGTAVDLLECNFDCAGVPDGGATVDCSGECGGTGEPDSCGVCTGGSTGLAPDFHRDYCGVCFGGDASRDSCGVCGGGDTDRDDCNVCFGENENLDDCGQCFLDNQAQDACGVCFGNSTSCLGCDGVPNSGRVILPDGSCGFPVSDGPSPPPDRQLATRESVINLGIILGLSAAALILLVVAVAIFFLRRRAQSRVSVYVTAKADAAPQGVVAIVFSDIQGSTNMWEERTEAMGDALELHNEIFRKNIELHHGYEVKTEGDAFMITFQDPVDALYFCMATQVELMRVQWPAGILSHPAGAVEWAPDGSNTYVFKGLRVRMGLHVGEPNCRFDERSERMDYYGPTINLGARVAGAAHGGQVFLSAAAYEAVRAAILARGGTWVTQKMGSHKLRGIAEPVALIQCLPLELSLRDFPDIGKDNDTHRTNFSSVPQSRRSSIASASDAASDDNDGGEGGGAKAFVEKGHLSVRQNSARSSKSKTSGAVDASSLQTALGNVVANTSLGSVGSGGGGGGLGGGLLSKDYSGGAAGEDSPGGGTGARSSEHPPNALPDIHAPVTGRGLGRNRSSGGGGKAGVDGGLSTRSDGVELLDLPGLITDRERRRN